MTSTKLGPLDDISSQALGLTDSHIYFFGKTIKSNIQPVDKSTALGIHRQMRNDFQALVENAAKADIEIKIASGFRSFERQLLIWNNKFMGKTPIKNINGEFVNIAKLNDFEIIEAILLFSALPGASRHHWGCDIDIYAPNLLGNQALQLEPWEYASSGPMAKLSTWLAVNARKYGFYFPYDCYRGGIAAEPWHLSYGSLANQYQSTFNLGSLQKLLLQTEIAGKEAIIENLSVIFNRYINNVNTGH